MDLTSIITEAALDDRISDGVVDLKNSTHIQVIAETMCDCGVDIDIINEFVKKFVEEGKYPERQAFNKEGWLVTFPSKEYRDRAIKKGTHSISDPTHGKGGMNLYYKKRGKQKRQTQQSTTTTDDQTQDPAAPRGAQPQQSNPQTAPEKQEPAQDDAPGADEMGPEEIGPDDGETNPPTPDNQSQSGSSLPPAGKPSSTPTSDSGAAGEDGRNTAGTATPPPAPPPPAPPPPPPYVELSKKFAAQKAWISTPFGEWRDSQGNAVAVEALTKEIVPLKNTDRDELKLFVQKHMPVA